MTRFARLPFALALLPVAVCIAAAQTVRARQTLPKIEDHLQRALKLAKRTDIAASK